MLISADFDEAVAQLFHTIGISDCSHLVYIQDNKALIFAERASEAAAEL